MPLRGAAPPWGRDWYHAAAEGVNSTMLLRGRDWYHAVAGTEAKKMEHKTEAQKMDRKTESQKMDHKTAAQTVDRMTQPQNIRAKRGMLQLALLWTPLA